MIPIKDNIPNDRFPLVTVALILTNLVVYALSVRHGGSLLSGPGRDEVLRYGAVAHQLAAGQRLGTIFSSAFMHASALHLGANMLFLWIFGPNVEESMGRARFVGFYLLGAVAALALWVVLSPGSDAPTIGASGAVAAVLAGYLVLYPGARVIALVPILLMATVVELPAIVMAVLWFVQQIIFAAVNLTAPNGGGGPSAYVAHGAGFVIGLTTIRLLAARAKQVPARRPAY